MSRLLTCWCVVCSLRIVSPCFLLVIMRCRMLSVFLCCNFFHIKIHFSYKINNINNTRFTKRIDTCQRYCRHPTSQKVIYSNTQEFNGRTILLVQSGSRTGSVSGHMPAVNYSTRRDESSGSSFTAVCVNLLFSFSKCILQHSWPRLLMSGGANREKTQVHSPPPSTRGARGRRSGKPHFLRWNASQCEQFHQRLSPTEILRWWMALMDWFKPRPPPPPHWLTE